MSKGMYDTTCKCGKRFGWSGKVTDRPNCPKCGHRPSSAELQKDEAEIDSMFRLLGTHPREATADTLREMRLFSGLGLRQAAKRLQILPSDLCKIENGQIHECSNSGLDLPDGLWDAMAELYGCGRK